MNPLNFSVALHEVPTEKQRKRSAENEQGVNVAPLLCC